MSELTKKLAKMIGMVKQPVQSKKHSHKNFSYSTRDDLFAVVRGLCAEVGVVFVPVLDLLDYSEFASSQKGNTRFRAVVKLHMSIMDTETNEELPSVWVGEGIASDETAIQSAATQAMRFFLINTFMLFDGEGEAQYGAQAPGETTKVVEPKPEGVAAQIAAYCGVQGLSDDETHRFLKYIQNSEKKRSIEQVPDAVLNNWLQKMKPLSAEDFCARVRKNINQRNAKGGEVKTASYEVGARQ